MKLGLGLCVFSLPLPAQWQRYTCCFMRLFCKLLLILTDFCKWKIHWYQSSSEQNKSLTKLASKFIPVSGIRAVGQDFAGLKYSELSDQLPGILIITIVIINIRFCMLLIIDHSIFIGLSTRSTLRKLLEEGDICPPDESKFYWSVRVFLCPSNEVCFRQPTSQRFPAKKMPSLWILRLMMMPHFLKLNTLWKGWELYYKIW